MLRPQCFPRSRRLARSDEFSAVLKANCRSIDHCFMVAAVPNGLAAARLGLAVGRKNIRLAVDRNRIKRVVRESFRQEQGSLDALDLVVIAKIGAGQACNMELHGALRKHWSRIARCAHSRYTLRT